MIDKWIRFRWALDPSMWQEAAVITPLTIRRAEPEDADTVGRVIKSAFSNDTTWADDSRTVSEALEARAEQAFEANPPSCVVVQHGSRIIGASLLALAPDAESHLLSGPCILNEYRSRGIGSALLQASLRVLGEQGLTEAYGVAPATSAAARFVYPKFGGVGEAFRSAQVTPAQVAA